MGCECAGLGGVFNVAVGEAYRMLDTSLPAKVSTAREIIELCAKRVGGKSALSRLSGYDKVTLNNWCNGKYTPNVSALRDMCEAANLEFVMGVVDL